MTNPLTKDAVKKTAEKLIEDKIQNKIRELAIERLKDIGELPADYGGEK